MSNQHCQNFLTANNNLFNVKPKTLSTFSTLFVWFFVSLAQPCYCDFLTDLTLSMHFKEEAHEISALQKLFVLMTANENFLNIKRLRKSLWVKDIVKTMVNLKTVSKKRKELLEMR